MKYSLLLKLSEFLYGATSVDEVSTLHTQQNLVFCHITVVYLSIESEGGLVVLIKPQVVKVKKPIGFGCSGYVLFDSQINQ